MNHAKDIKRPKLQLNIIDISLLEMTIGSFGFLMLFVWYEYVTSVHITMILNSDKFSNFFTLQAFLFAASLSGCFNDCPPPFRRAWSDQASSGLKRTNRQSKKFQLWRGALSLL